MLAYLFDGPLIPSTEGASTRVLNLMKYSAIQRPNFCWIIKVKREVDKLKEYKEFSRKYNLNFLFVDKNFFYTNNGKKQLLSLIKQLKIKVVISKDMDVLLPLWYLNKIYNISDLHFLFDSHDVIHETFQQFYHFILKHPLKGEFKNIILKEIFTNTICDLHFVVSEVDRQKYIQIGCDSRKLQVVENCVDLKAISVKKQPHETFNVIFLGNMHYFPNYDAAKLILAKIAPLIEKEDIKIKFLMVGDYPNNLEKERKSSNVIFLGKVRDLNKVLKISDLAIVPIRYGSGTRLKILYLLAAEIPILTTKKGVEGLEIKKGIIIEDRITDFSQRIIEVAREPLKRRFYRANRKEVEKYSAEKIAKKMLRFIDKIN